MLDKIWLKRERNTARLVTQCFDYLNNLSGEPTAEQVKALIQLTWISSASNHAGALAPYIRSQKIPALALIYGISGRNPAGHRYRTVTQFFNSTTVLGRKDLLLAQADTGITNYYPAYRPALGRWVKNNKKAIWRLLKRARSLDSDEDRISLMRAVLALPRLRHRGPNKPPHPYVALCHPITCLDPEHRSPILNRGPRIMPLLKHLELNDEPPIEQFRDVLSLIAAYEFEDAFEIDCTDLTSNDSLVLPVVRPRSSNGKAHHRDLRYRDENDLRGIIDQSSRRIRLKHNRMTNALLKLSEKDTGKLRESTHPLARWDVLVTEYKRGRDLLVEVKSNVELGSCRLAIGQLLDYRRFVPRPQKTDIALLVPKKPSPHILEYCDELEVSVLWFNEKHTQIYSQTGRFSLK